MARKKSSVDPGFSGLSIVGDSDSVISVDKDLVHGDLRRKIINLQRSIDKSRWDLAEAIKGVHDEQLYSQWGFSTWEQYVETEVGLNVRTAQYIMAMYTWFEHSVGSKLDPEEKAAMIAAVRELGWTKGRCLTGVCDDTNYEKWIELARNISSTDLETETKKALVKKSGGDPDEVSSMSTLSCKLADDQRSMVDEAFEIATKATGSKKKGNLLSLICQTYVADNMGQGDDMETNRDRALTRIGSVYNVDIVAVDPSSNKVLIGRDVLKRLGFDIQQG